MNYKYQLRYLVVPEFLFKENRLTTIAFKVYCFIHSYNGEMFYFSSDHLAQMFNCSDRSIKRAFEQLRDLKYIKTELQIKEGGGSRRFVKDLYKKDTYVPSEGTTLSPRDEANEGTTLSPRDEANLNLAKDNNIKENNKKENFGEDPLEERNKLREQRKARKSKFGSSFTRSPYSKPVPKFEKKPFTIADGRGIV